MDPIVFDSTGGHLFIRFAERCAAQTAVEHMSSVVRMGDGGSGAR